MTNDLRQEIRLDELSPPLSHYTDAVRFGNLLFIWGIAPLDEAGALVGGEDAAAQTHRILEILAKLLRAADAGVEDVLRVTVYLTDINDRTAINPVRHEFFGDSRPASTLIGVNELAVPGMKVEIEAIVGLPG